VGQEPVLAQVVLPVVEVILTLLRLIGKIEFGQLSKSAETKHGEGARQACHRTAATLHSSLEQLAVNILHIL
jgi:hypothetical protein